MEWKPKHARVFLSHIVKHKALVGDVSRELLDFGIHGFVAHDHITPTRAWENEMEDALQTCEAMALFLHSGFRASEWTDQETGIGLSRGVLMIPLRIDMDPYGFVGKFQAVPATTMGETAIARSIFEAMMRDKRTRYSVTTGLVEAVARSRSFKQANDRSKYLSQVDGWIAPDLVVLRDALATNSQVSDAFYASDRIAKILGENPIDKAPPF